MNINMSLKEAYGWFLWALTQVVLVGLLVLFAANVLALFGFRIPNVPTMDYTALAYLAGAWWLYRKAG